MSDSESDVAIPDPAKIEKTLRAIVARLYKAGDHEELTVKRVRKAAESKLELPDDFLKENETWKSKSKDIIADEHEKQENEEAASSPVKPAKPVKPTAKPKAVPRLKKAAEPAKQGTKRPPLEAKAKPQKKRKVTVSSESEDEESAISSVPSDVSEEELSEEEAAPRKALKSRAKRVTTSPKAQIATQGPEAKRATKSSKTKPKPHAKSRNVVDSEEEDESSPEPQPTKRDSKKAVDPKEEDASLQPQSEKVQLADSDVDMEEPPAPAEAPPAEADASESEMSVLIDEEPPPKKKRQKKDPGSKPTKAKAEPKTKAAPKSKPDLSPQEAQIKELQGQLVKCGIRKMWHNELKNCETPKEKISHLKNLLKEAGMDGRFSESKAKEIKERRELEKDMEEAKDYAAKFGAQEDKGRRKLGAIDWGIDESLLGGGDDSDSD